MDEQIMITITCLAYNHERYIEKTLEGFVKQKTNFRFEVIVHDDASTDKTPQIIKEYETKYPSLFRVVYQTENQYSKGISITNKILSPMARGKYRAVCEGDDYWTDENKLQMQFDYMETHSQCSLCVHNTMMIADNGEPLGKLFKQSKEEQNYTAEDVIVAKGGGLFHTSSFFYKHEHILIKPNCYFVKGMGDYPTAIYLSTRGYVHYFPQVMSAYRVGSQNSWVKNMTKRSQGIIKVNENLISSLTDMNVETEGVYASAFDRAIQLYQFDNCVLNNDFVKIFRDKKMLTVLKKMPPIQQMKLIVKMQRNKLYTVLNTVLKMKR